MTQNNISELGKEIEETLKGVEINKPLRKAIIQTFLQLFTHYMEKEREKIRADIIEFAIQGRFDADEMKGLQLYTKIIKYFDELS